MLQWASITQNSTCYVLALWSINVPQVINYSHRNRKPNESINQLTNSPQNELPRALRTGESQHIISYFHLSSEEFPAGLLYLRQDWEAARGPISTGVDKTAVVLLHNEILLHHKEEENFILWDSMDGPEEHFAKWNKPVGERQIPHVDSDEQTELTSQIWQTHRWRTGWQLWGEGLGVAGSSKKRKRTHGHGQQCGDFREAGVGRGGQGDKRDKQ